MDKPEKLATKGTQEEDKHNKNTMQYFHVFLGSRAICI